MPSAFPCRLSAAPVVPAFQELHTHSQRTDHRRTMIDTVDDALAVVHNDRKPSPPSPSPSPGANECTGTFIRLQHGLTLSDRPTFTYPASDSKLHHLSEQNTPSPGNGSERPLSSLRRPRLPPALYVVPWHILDVNSPPTRSFLCFSISHTSTRST